MSLILQHHLYASIVLDIFQPIEEIVKSPHDYSVDPEFIAKIRYIFNDWYHVNRGYEYEDCEIKIVGTPCFSLEKICTTKDDSDNGQHTSMVLHVAYFWQTEADEMTQFDIADALDDVEFVVDVLSLTNYIHDEIPTVAVLESGYPKISIEQYVCTRLY